MDNSKETVKVGDVVMIKSGGPEMTVVRVFENPDKKDMAECQWFQNNQLKKGEFSLDVLKPYKNQNTVHLNIV